MSSEFVSQLQTTRAGRVYASHLAAYDCKCSGETHSSQIQVSILYRALIAGLRSQKSVFGLPPKLPKFVLLGCFSGERVLLHSKSPDLLRTLVAKSGAFSTREKFVAAFEELVSAAEEENCSIIMVFCLPWQEGIGSVFFRMATVNPLTLDDSGCILTSLKPEAKTGKKTDENNEFPVDRNEFQALQKELFAVSVDEEISEQYNAITSGGNTTTHDTDDGQSTGDSQQDTSRMQILREALNTAQHQRNALKLELEQTKHTLTAEMEQIKLDAERTAAHTVQSTIQTRNAYKEKARIAQEALETSNHSLAKLTTELTHTKMALKEHESKLKSERASASKQTKTANAAISSLNSRLKDMEALLEKTKKELQCEKTRVVKDTDARVNKVLVELREQSDRYAESKRMVDRLSSAVEARENDASRIEHEYNSMQSRATDLEEQLNATKLLFIRLEADYIKECDYRARIKMAKEELEVRHRELQHDLKDARESAARNLELALQAEKATKTASTTTHTSTCNMATSTHQIASTQTEPMDFTQHPLTENVSEAGRQAYKSLLRLIELSQTPHSPYVAEFRGHWQPNPFRPKTDTSLLAPQNPYTQPINLS